MSQPHHSFPFTRRQLLTRIGALAGSVALYQAMTTMGHAAGTDFTHPPSLTGAKKGTRILVLGAGLAGMLSAYELRKAGYDVQILEFQNRSGGRNISLRAGDTVTELGVHHRKFVFQTGIISIRVRGVFRITIKDCYIIAGSLGLSLSRLLRSIITRGCIQVILLVVNL